MFRDAGGDFIPVAVTIRTWRGCAEMLVVCILGKAVLQSSVSISINVSRKFRVGNRRIHPSKISAEV
jgi:hypothetical protein